MRKMSLEQDPNIRDQRNTGRHSQRSGMKLIALPESLGHIQAA
jgi:hypothetical protein